MLPNCSKHIIFMKMKIDIVTFENDTEFFIPSSIKHLTYGHQYRSFVVAGLKIKIRLNRFNIYNALTLLNI